MRILSVSQEFHPRGRPSPIRIGQTPPTWARSSVFCGRNPNGGLLSRILNPEFTPVRQQLKPDIKFKRRRRKVFTYREVHKLADVNRLAAEGWELVTAYADQANIFDHRITYVLKKEARPIRS
jgi:hypothetical protein